MTKINILSPFGSGNPEPKFIVENLKSINSKIVGDKHIKSILIGAEGSNIKTIAFNAVDNELGAYLLKKNNNTFNIAGKLSLNEWRGQKNVEFIIDDISVNKNIKKIRSHRLTVRTDGFQSSNRGSIPHLGKI